MAFKFTVDYENLRVIIDTDSLEPVSVFQDLRSLVTFTNIENVVQYVNLSAVNVFLDDDTKNLYFSSQYGSAEALVVTLSEVLVFDLQRLENHNAMLCYSKFRLVLIFEWLIINIQ